MEFTESLSEYCFCMVPPFRASTPVADQMAKAKKPRMTRKPDGGI
jgi:hypothetical protein